MRYIYISNPKSTRRSNSRSSRVNYGVQGSFEVKLRLNIEFIGKYKQSFNVYSPQRHNIKTIKKESIKISIERFLS